MTPLRAALSLIVIASTSAVLGCSSGPSRIVLPSRECSITPATIDFGQVPLGFFSDTVVTITNTGDVDLIGDLGSGLVAGFTVLSPSHYELSVGESQTFAVRFEPSTVGDYHASLGTNPVGCETGLTGKGVPFFWTTVIIDSTGDTGYSPSLALDPRGGPHIAYVTADGALRYAEPNLVGWSIEVVDAGVQLPSLNALSLRLDGSEAPHIVYSNGQVRHVYRSGGTWIHHDPDRAGSYPDLALSSAGKARIVFTGSIQPGDPVLAVGVESDAGWSFDKVDSLSDGGWGAIDLDPLERLHVAYVSRVDAYGIRHAWKNGSAWIRDTISAEVATSSNVSLRVGSDGVSHVVYRGSGGSCKYTNNGIGAWDGPILLEGDQGHSLALDAGDQPRIALSNDQGLRYGTGPAFTFQTVFGGLNVSGQNSLALAANGIPCIAWTRTSGGTGALAFSFVPVVVPLASRWPLASRAKLDHRGAMQPLGPVRPSRRR